MTTNLFNQSILNRVTLFNRTVAAIGAIAVALVSQPVSAQTAVLTSSMTPICLNGCSSAPNESVSKISDGNVNTKFLDFNKLNTGFYINTGGTQIINRVDLTTGNDSPERDPTSFILSGSTNGTSWTTITTVSIPCIATRLFTRSFSFTNTVGYSWFKIQFPSVCNTSTSNSMQIAEVQLYKNAGPLPIKLISFDGQVKNSRAELSWAIAQPEENAVYEIQHSLNGQQFTSVYTKAVNNNNLRFSFAANLAAGTNYYRLKTTDKMGEVSYSNIISLKNNGTGSSISTYPNPVKQGTQITLFVNNKTFTNWALYNMYGQKVAGKTGNFTGNTNLQLPAQISKGLYMLHLSGNGDKMVTSLMVD